MNINAIVSDAETLLAAIKTFDPNSDIVGKLEATLGWKNPRIRLAAEELKADGRIRATLNDSDGGPLRLIAITVS